MSKNRYCIAFGCLNSTRRDPNLTLFSLPKNVERETPVRQHLKNVYCALTMTCCAAFAGVCLDMVTGLHAHLLSAFAVLGFVILLLVNPDNGKNTDLRVSFLLGIGFTSGMGLGTLLEQAISVDPAIVMTALLGTTLVFVCFSVAAMLAQRDSWLFHSGVLLTLLFSVTTLSLANIYIQSTFIFQMYLYAYLMVLCLYVLYDTHLIIEKCRLGHVDFVMHALTLFIDFIRLFEWLVVTDTEEERRRKHDD